MDLDQTIHDAARQQGLAHLAAGQLAQGVARLVFAARVLTREGDGRAVTWLSEALGECDLANRQLDVLIERAQLASILRHEQAVNCWQAVIDHPDCSVQLRCRALVHAYWANPGPATVGALAVDASVEPDAGGWGNKCRALAAALAGDLDTALDADTAALAVARERDDHELEALALRGIGYVRSYRGDLGAAVRALRESIAVCDIAGAVRWSVETRLSLVDVLLEDMRIPEALVEAGTLVTMLERGDVRDRIGRARISLAQVLAYSGNLRRALEVLALDSEGDDESEALRSVWRADVLLEAGDLEGALACNPEQVLARAREQGFASQVFEASFMQLQLRAAQGADLAELTTRAGADEMQIDEPVSQARVARWLARTAVRRNEPSLLDVAEQLAASIEVNSPLIDIARDEIAAVADALSPSLEQSQLWNIGDRYEQAGRVLDALRCRVSAALVERPEQIARDPQLAVDRLLQLQGDLVRTGAGLDTPLAAGCLARALAQLPGDLGLAGSGVLTGLTARDVRTIEARASTSDFASGETIYEGGVSAPPLGIVRAGVVQVTRSSVGGRELIAARLHPGDIFGLGGLAGSQTHEVTRASTDAQITFVDHDAAHALMRDLPAFGTNLVRQLAAQVEAAQQLATRIAYLSAEQHVAWVLDELVQHHGRDTLDGRQVIDIAFSHDELARMIGSSRNSVTSAISSLKRLGVVDTRGRKLLVDTEQLARAIEPVRAN